MHNLQTIETLKKKLKLRTKLFVDAKILRECQQLGFATLNSNPAVSGWVGLA